MPSPGAVLTALMSAGGTCLTISCETSRLKRPSLCRPCATTADQNPRCGAGKTPNRMPDSLADSDFSALDKAVVRKFKSRQHRTGYVDTSCLRKSPRYVVGEG